MLYFTDSCIFLQSSLGSHGLQSNPQFITKIELYHKVIMTQLHEKQTLLAQSIQLTAGVSMKFTLDRNNPPCDPFQYAQLPLVLFLLGCSRRASGQGRAGFLCYCIVKGCLLCDEKVTLFYYIMTTDINNAILTLNNGIYVFKKILFQVNFQKT